MTAEQQAAIDPAAIPQDAVCAVLDDWEARYAAGDEGYEPDPSHRSLVRDALAIAYPYLRADLAKR